MTTTLDKATARGPGIRPLPNTPALAAVARRTVWFKTPEQALADTVHLIAHVLTYGTSEDVSMLRRHVTNDELRMALDNAPPGIFDPRSLGYWNLKLGRQPAPPLPRRNLP
jgi:hypothetical protein